MALIVKVFKQVFMINEHFNEIYDKRTNGHFIELKKQNFLQNNKRLVLNTFFIS